MSCSLRLIPIVLAALATTANAQAAGKGRPPTPHPPHLTPPKPHLPKPPPLPKVHLPKPPAVHPVYKAPRPLSYTKVSRHPRPAVTRHAVQRIRHSAPRMVRQPVRRAAFRTVHRYPVHRVSRRFVRRPYYYYSGFGRHGYSYYPRRYLWRTSLYNRGYGLSRRRLWRGIGGIVESVQGNAGNGMLVVKTLRSRSSRFRYVRANAAGWGATSLHRFHLNLGTSYQVVAGIPRLGTIADLHRGERVLVLTQANSGRTAQTVRILSGRRR